MIKGLTRTDYIVIPNWIDNYPQLEKQLQTLAPIEEKTKEHRYATVRALLSMISIPLMVGSFLVKDKAVAAIFAVLAVGLLGWIYYETRVSKNMPENLRRRSWTYLIMIAAIIYITWQKFTA